MFRYFNIIFILTFFILCIELFPQREELTFEHITLKDGLPGERFETIYKDSFGFIWIGTHSGLARYDGNEIVVYKHSDDDSCSIVSNLITDIEEDDEYNLWIGTTAGLSKYIRKTDNFTNYRHNPNNPRSVSGNYINGIYKDLINNMWISTAKNGLNKIQKDEALTNSPKIKFTQIKLEAEFSEIKYVRGMREDLNGNLWIGTQRGLVKLNLMSLECNLYQLINSNDYHPKNDFLSPVVDGRKIWLSTRFNGLICFDTEYETFEVYLPTEESNAYHTPNKLTNIQMDGNLIWLGTWGAGVLVFDKSQKSFTQYEHNPIDPQSLIMHRSHIGSLILDDMGTLWVAAYGGGISKVVKEKNLFRRIWFGSSEVCPKDRWQNVGWGRIHNQNNGEILVRSIDKVYSFNPSQNKFVNEIPQPYDYKILEDEYVAEILPESENIYWIATRKGLKKSNTLTGETIYYRAKKNEDQPYSHNEIFKMIKDKDGIIWLATHMGGELVSFDPKTEKFSFFRYDSVNVQQISNVQHLMRILSLCEGTDNSIWIVTNDGRIFNFNKSKSSFRNYELPSRIGTSNIFEDRKGRVWLWASSNKLILMDKKTGDYKIIKIPQGFTSDSNQSFYEDKRGNIWKNTKKGMIKINGETLEVTPYQISYGNESLSDMYACQSTGYLFSATVNNLYFFHPDSLRKNEEPPKIILTGFYLFNEPVQTGDDTPLIENINVIEEIKLNHWQNDFSIKFAALHYVDPSNNQYKYMLENYDDKGRVAGSSRKADYTNISPGKYIFRVIASNSDGYWNEDGASLKIIILPPWWATTWAYIIYALIVLGIIYYTWRLQLKRIRIKQEYEMSKFEAEKMHEVDEMKSRFFANISHEFRTPLTLIIGPVKQLIERIKDEKNKNELKIVHRNARRLHGLVNQLLDLSKLESGKMKLETSIQNIIPLLKGLVSSFASFAERKRITLNFISEVEVLEIYFDKEKMEKIVTNLLSNAFKFTPEGGTIVFSVVKQSKEIVLSIKDSGIGIVKERLEKIFDRFYQVDGSHTRKQEGTGLGLALTKELVELHKGKIEVDSDEGKGSTFIVTLPLGKNHLSPEEIIEKDIVDEKGLVEHPLIEEEIASKEKILETDTATSLNDSLLLIVEDNSDVRHYIRTNIEEKYRIIEAINGEDGLKKAIENIPDLIISDVMMPMMDGFEMCTKIKTNEKTSHIPIIMLTAKATSKDKIEGYEIGADDYIMKPFNTEELRARIKNLIDIRRKLQEKFSIGDYPPKIKNKRLGKIDEEFMKKIVATIERHIGEEEFTIEEFEGEFAMSRAQFHRKLKAITGKSPSIYLRSVRLAKAKKMIEEQTGNISEIAYSVGFGSPTYFSKCFKEEFGYSPSKLAT